MTQTIESFVEKLHAEGVHAGQEAAEKLRSEARAEAERVVAEAKAEAEKLLAEAKAKAANWTSPSGTWCSAFARNSATPSGRC